MSNFVFYEATGLIHKRDDKGNLVYIDRVFADGVVRAGKGMLGAIFRQKRELLPCDSISVTTYNL